MLSPEVRAVLRSPYSIRRFFITAGVVLIVVVAMMAAVIALLPEGCFWRTLLSELCSDLAATLAVVMLSYAFFLYITPRGLRDAQILPLRRGEIADEIVDLTKNVSDYWFWGRSGSYFRAAVLPKLDKHSKSLRQHVTARIVVPDPRRAENGVRYAAIKTSLGEQANESTLAENVLATLAAALLAQRGNPYFKVHIGLCPSVPVLRFDLSTAGGVVTRDAKELPAILVNGNNPYFEMLRDAVENELAQSAFALATRGDDIQSTLEEIALALSLDSSTVPKAKQLLGSADHRYG